MSAARTTPEVRDARGSRLAWAAVLIVGSLLLLIFNFNLLRRYEPLSDYIVAGVLALGGVAFFVSVVSHPQAWWRLIPGWTLLALALMVLVARQGAGRWVAALLFAGLALAFLNIYLLNRAERWWALLPGGFLAVLGLVVGLSNSITRLEVLGAILFAGLGVVFLLLGAAGGPQSRYWAQIPGSILLLFGFFVLAGDSARVEEGLVWWARWWPLLPLLLGLVIGWRAFAGRSAAPRLEVNRAPAPSAAVAAAAGAAPEREPLGAYSQPAPGASVQLLSDE